MNTHGLPDRVALKKDSGEEVLALFHVSMDHAGNGQCGYFSDGEESLQVPVVDGHIDNAVRSLRDLLRQSAAWAIVPG